MSGKIMNNNIAAACVSKSWGNYVNNEKLIETRWKDQGPPSVNHSVFT